MIPLLAVLKFEGRHNITLWLPFVLLYVLVFPLLFVLLILVDLPSRIARKTPRYPLRALWDVLAGLRGLSLEASSRGNAISVHLV